MQMRSMFDRSPAITRFEKTDELTPVVTIVKKLRLKKLDLKADALVKGPESNDQKKYDVVGPLVLKIDEKIGEFNNLPVPADDTARIAQIYRLAESIKKLAEETLRTSSDKLSVPRNENRQHAKNYLRYSTLVAVAIPALSWPFLLGACSVLAVKEGGDRVIDMAGLNNIDPASFKLVKDLANDLNDICINLNPNAPAASAPQPS